MSDVWIKASSPINANYSGTFLSVMVNLSLDNDQLESLPLQFDSCLSGMATKHEFHVYMKGYICLYSIDYIGSLIFR